MPPVSNVFHSYPQVQDQRSSLLGDQPQSGQRMRGRTGRVLRGCENFSACSKQVATKHQKCDFWVVLTR
jgi:hypothetical protein